MTTTTTIQRQQRCQQGESAALAERMRQSANTTAAVMCVPFQFAARHSWRVRSSSQCPRVKQAKQHKPQPAAAAATTATLTVAAEVVEVAATAAAATTTAREDEVVDTVRVPDLGLMLLVCFQVRCYRSPSSSSACSLHLSAMWGCG